ncbi:MAG: hypothetical protein ACYCV7_13125, partial [Acidimicrobiales bacterium]
MGALVDRHTVSTPGDSVDPDAHFEAHRARGHHLGHCGTLVLTIGQLVGMTASQEVMEALSAHQPGHGG